MPTHPQVLKFQQVSSSLLSALDAQQRFMQSLSARGKLDRKVEGLPNDARMRELMASGTPLSRPEIAVLTAYGKLELSDDIVASSFSSWQADPARRHIG